MAQQKNVLNMHVHKDFQECISQTRLESHKVPSNGNFFLSLL